MKNLKTYKLFEQIENFNPNIGDILIIKNDEDVQNIFFILEIMNDNKVRCFGEPPHITIVELTNVGVSNLAWNIFNVNDIKYKLLNPKYFYENFSDDMVQVIYNMRTLSQFGDKELLDNFISMWLNNVPELKITLETDKYNL